MLDESTYQGLKAKYGVIAETDAPDGRTIAIRQPDTANYRAFIASVAKDNTNKEALIRDMVRESAVYPVKEDGSPDHDAIDAIIEKYPGVPLALSGAITDMTGTSVEVRIRKN